MSDQPRWLHISVPAGRGTRMCSLCELPDDDIYIAPGFSPHYDIVLCARCAGELAQAVEQAGQREETTT